MPGRAVAGPAQPRRRITNLGTAADKDNILAQALGPTDPIELLTADHEARESVDQPQLLDQAEAEHRSAKALIAHIQRTDPTSPQYDMLVTQLQAAVTQHVQDEEGEIFPQMQGSAIDLQQLGEQLALRRDEVLDELEQAD